MTESLVWPLLRNEEMVPSMGFSGAVSSIVQGEVLGVPINDDKESETWGQRNSAVNEKSSLVNNFNRVHSPRSGGRNTIGSSRSVFGKSNSGMREYSINRNSQRATSPEDVSFEVSLAQSLGARIRDDE
jgi:hypothetical protein